MRPSSFAWPAALALVTLAALGCSTKISIDDTDSDPDPDPGCEGERPDIPNDAWCPPVYECIDGAWVDVGGACPEPLCPESKPLDGSSCEMVGQVCYYEQDVPCGETELMEFNCTSNGWLGAYEWCQPEPECPVELPVVGTDCTGWEYAYACQYLVENACGQEMMFLACSYTESGDQLWTSSSTSTCNICNGNGTEAECALAPECQWLTPGCGPDPIQTGCYPKEGCDVAGCPTDDSICVMTTYDPCYGQLCEACGASFFACLPAWAP